MKYRIQLNAVFPNTIANTILNEVESMKTDVYEAQSFTEVAIERIGKKLEVVDEYETATEYETINFDAGQATHSGSPEGTGFVVVVDISFSSETDCNTFLNYIETVKSNADSNKLRSCRYFECNHEEIPLKKDGSYSYINFDGEQITH